MAKKQERQDNQMEQFTHPHYLSIHPLGEDLYEGKSQERLAQAIAMHIQETDKSVEPVFARLIGIEGKWGSGKSNVIKILEHELKGTYTFFCFDAWGNQEDLQRRSILELVTRYLMKPEINKLTGKTKMRVMNSEKSGCIKEEDCTWHEKLESLLSRKSYSREISVPSVYKSTKFFVLSLLVMGLVISFLSVSHNELWWVNALIAASPFILFSLGMLITWSSWCKMFAMYNTGERSDITSYVISEQEPSVREFKDWMTEISNGIPAKDKLVLVFDNMDRLSTEKVHQFWSLIQTFFADDGYKNIWCIVPYDEAHLASVFSEANGESSQIQLLRGFLDKTFPVIYRVPEPIVSDYKYIFEKLFREAFGTTVGEEHLELISQCYRQTYPTPNVREMISFVNHNVLLAKQWGESISDISRAIYVLKSDNILRNPILRATNSGKLMQKTVTTDEYILANEYCRDYYSILVGNIQLDDMMREIAALVYGIDPNEADQIVVKRYIRNCLGREGKDSNLSEYVNNPHFMMLLLEDVLCMSPSDYMKAVAQINEIEESKLTDEGKDYLRKIWHYFGIRYNARDNTAKEYTDYEKAIFSHVESDLVEKCANHFCKLLIDNKEVSGTQLFQELSKLFEEDFAKSLVPYKVCPESVIEAKRFADYVQAAGKEYQRFPISADPLELNGAIEQTIDKDFPYIDALSVLKGDERYKISEVGNFAVQQLNLQESSALVAENLIKIQRLFFDKFQSKLNANYVTSLWQEVQTEQGKAAYDEIFALKSVGVYEQLPSKDSHIDILIEKVLFYTSTKELISQYIANTGITFRVKLLKKMIIEKRHDDAHDYPEFIEEWPIIVTSLGISKEDMILFADSWGYKDISEQEQGKSFFTLLSDITWIDALLATDTPLAQKLLSKCVSEMSEQSINQYLQPNTSSHANTNWNKALQKLVDTEYITPDSFGLMAEIAANLLDWVARNNRIDDETWNVLLAKVNYASISTQVIDIRNHILNGESGYAMTPAKFQYLHEWLEKADINTEIHCSDAANQILSKVVDADTCQEIILANKEYYKSIIANTMGTASSLHGKLKSIVEKGEDTDFTEYIKGIVKYDNE